jgi:hypothetical protein
MGFFSHHQKAYVCTDLPQATLIAPKYSMAVQGRVAMVVAAALLLTAHALQANESKPTDNIGEPAFA